MLFNKLFVTKKPLLIKNIATAKLPNAIEFLDKSDSISLYSAPLHNGYACDMMTNNAAINLTKFKLLLLVDSNFFN